MIVECPRCRARYRVESGLLEQDQTFKCSRCNHIFAHEAEAAAPTPPLPSHSEPRPPWAEPPVARKPGPDVPSASPPLVIRHEDPPLAPRDVSHAESLSLAFPARDQPKDQADGEPEPPPRPVFVDKGPPNAASREFSFGEDDQDDRFSDRGGDRDDDGEGARDRATDDQPRFVRGEDELRIHDEESTNPTRSYLVFLGALMLAYAILALDLLNHPARAEKLLAAVPIVGDTIAQDQLLQIKVHLEDVEGVFQQIKDDRSVFIVSGRAVNTSSEALKGVKIESVLYDRAGRSIEVKNIYCGNAMSLKIVKDLSSKEISLLQQLEPPKRFEIRPGESAGFSVVFLAPPSGVREFTARVLSALASLS